MSKFMSIEEFNQAQERLGLNNTQFAEELGITRNSVQRYKNGTRVISKPIKVSINKSLKIKKLLQK